MSGSTGAADASVEVSVIIPCRGHAEQLGPLIADLVRQRTTRIFEIIVVDAAADDAVLAEATIAGARVVRSSDGLLPGVARDLGVAHARGAVLAFIDADCRPDEGWLEAAVAALGPDVRIVGGPVADLCPWHPVARADNLLQFADLPRSREPGPVHILPSCNLALGVEDYGELDGFKHEAGIATGEDVALCERAAERWPGAIRFIPAMAVRHGGRTTLGGLLRHHRAFGYSRGRLKLLLTERQARLGRMAALAPAVAIRRVLYVFGRVLCLHPTTFPAALLLTPLLALGAAAWTLGFHRGLADRASASPGRTG